MIERLPVSGSILEVAMQLVFLEKTLTAYFPLWPNSLFVVVAQPDEKLPNRTKKFSIRLCGYRQTQMWLIYYLRRQMNETINSGFFYPHNNGLELFELAFGIESRNTAFMMNQ